MHIEEIVRRTFWTYNFTVKALSQVERWLNLQYKLPKIDFVSVEELPTKCVNTWGMLRVREPLLFYDEDVPSSVPFDIHQTGALTIVNGILSSWLGNDVTPKEWKDSWMTDGFLTYLQYLITDKILPEWRLKEQFVIQEIQTALSSKKQVNDDIPNARYASVIRMLHFCLGDAVFQNSIRNYIVNGTFQVSQPDQLFANIQSEVNKNQLKLPASIKTILESWIISNAYPVVTASLKNNVISITQKLDNQYIPISILYADKAATIPLTWFQPNEANLEIIINSSITNNTWFIVNKNVVGLFRVNYDESNWKLLIKELMNNISDIIHVENKAQLIDDSFNLALHGELDFDIALDVLNYIKNEVDFIPWTTAKNALLFLENMLRGRPNYNLLEKYIQNITTKIYDKVPLKNILEANHQTRLLRNNVATLACQAGLNTCVREVEATFERFLNKTEFPVPELHELIFCTATKYMTFTNSLTNSLVKYIMEIITRKEIYDRNELYRILSGVGCTRDPKLVKRALEITTMRLPPAFNIDIRPSDRQYLFNSVAVGSYIGTKEALLHIKNNFVAIRARFSSIAGLFDTIGPYVTTDELLNLVKDVASAHNSKLTPDIQNAINRAISHGEENLKWVNSNHGKIIKWLRQHVQIESDNTGGNRGNLLTYNKYLIQISTIVSLCVINFYLKK